MRDSRPQLLDNIFSDVDMLNNVQQRAAALLKLNRAVIKLLPHQLQAHCRVANYRKGILVLETHSANWLMGLRYEQPKLLETLREEILPTLIAIDIKINPTWQIGIAPITQTAQSEQPTREMTSKAAEYIEMLATNCPDSLAKKLKKLASLAEKNRKES